MQPGAVVDLHDEIREVKRVEIERPAHVLLRPESTDVDARCDLVLQP
jgi:hypothetical protein